MFLLERGLKNAFAMGLLVRIIITSSEWANESQNTQFPLISLSPE